MKNSNSYRLMRIQNQIKDHILETRLRGNYKKEAVMNHLRYFREDIKLQCDHVVSYFKPCV